VDVGSPLVTHLQLSIAVQPRQSPLHHPPVPTQPLAGLDAAPGDSGTGSGTGSGGATAGKRCRVAVSALGAGVFLVVSGLLARRIVT
jgi:hypothetical protein